MGRVWAARQVGSPLQRLVAVKTAISGQSQTPEFQRLFMDEARIASLIHHPHVCGVYELGEEHGTLYLVMEWCDGVSLRQVMDKLEGRMDLAVACRIVANVAAGLHAAHELEDSDGTKLRVVHRDVSPQNVLISKNGHVKVADFGVAKAQGQLHRPTETGEMKGKLAYMAPEQVTAKDIDHRADIFALGCVLYEVTVGRRPFQGEGALSTLYQLLEQAVVAPTQKLPS
jgi:serine/threonine protein kinase